MPFGAQNAMRLAAAPKMPRLGCEVGHDAEICAKRAHTKFNIVIGDGNGRT
jgi:hypothetical protein